MITEQTENLSLSTARELARRLSIEWRDRVYVCVQANGLYCIDTFYPDNVHCSYANGLFCN